MIPLFPGRGCPSFAHASTPADCLMWTNRPDYERQRACLGPPDGGRSQPDIPGEPATSHEAVIATGRQSSSVELEFRNEFFASFSARADAILDRRLVHCCFGNLGCSKSRKRGLCHEVPHPLPRHNSFFATRLKTGSQHSICRARNWSCGVALVWFLGLVGLRLNRRASSQTRNGSSGK